MRFSVQEGGDGEEREEGAFSARETVSKVRIGVRHGISK